MSAPGPTSPAAVMPSGPPIMVLGCMPRSGTNHLIQLLARHPDCGRPFPLREDYFLERAHHLRAYADELWTVWSQWWPGTREELDDQVFGGLGIGLLGLLQSHCPAGRVVTKTPGTGNLDLAFRLFPIARLIILVRDGRSVVESFRRSFPEHPWRTDDRITEIAELWAHSIDRILTFRRAHSPLRYNYIVVRYEDLFRDPEDMMARILDVAALDRARYDFAAVRDMPVIGSSVDGRHADGGINWRPSPRPEGFAPLERWRDWTADEHERFNRVAGDAMRAFGYRLVEDG